MTSGTRHLEGGEPSAKPSRIFSILDAAKECPDHLGMISDERNWTFAELAGEVTRVLPGLLPRPQEQLAEAPVALVGAATTPLLIALYSLLELRRPMALLHPRWTAAERKARQALVAAEPLIDEGWRIPPADSAANSELPHPLSRPRFSALVFTSGSGGLARGALLSHRALAASAAASATNLGWRADDRWLLSLPIAHVGGLSIVTRCLAGRKTVVLASSSRFDPFSFENQLHRHRITLVSLVPTMLRRLLDRNPSWRPPDHLRALLLGGAPASPDLLREAADRGIPVLTTYGLTEACSQVATQRPGTVNRGELGCGPPLPGLKVRIHRGEIQVRGDTLMEGYLPRDPEASPFTDDGWLATGDLGSLDKAGNLHVLGRRSQLLITGGENVHPAEVEAVLSSHPALVAACVFGIEDRVWGQQVVTALVPGTAPPTDQELLEFLEARLARFKHPRKIAYLQELCLLPNAKVDRKATAEKALPLLRPLSQR